MHFSVEIDKNLILIYEIKADSKFQQNCILDALQRNKVRTLGQKRHGRKGALVRNNWNLQPLFYSLITTILSVALRMRAICKSIPFI